MQHKLKVFLGTRFETQTTGKHRKKKMIKNKLLFKISSLYYVENLTQQEIADNLNYSRSNISRCLEKARSEKIVEIKLNYPEGNFNELEFLIEDKYKMNECIIVPSSESADEVLKNMALELGELLDRVLKPSDYVGVNWGYTLKEVVGCLKVQKKPGIKIIPMMGGLGKIDTGIQANLVSRTLAEKLGGISHPIHFPAFFNNKEIKKAVEEDRNVKEIVELSKKINWAILGMSSTTGDNTLLRIKEFTGTDMNYLNKLGAVGDLNLNWINNKGQYVANKINDRTLTVSYERIKQIKNVIGIAFGENKVEVIKGALNGKLISILITDEKTANLLI